jgi:hypothetical protein
MDKDELVNEIFRLEKELEQYEVEEFSKDEPLSLVHERNRIIQTLEDLNKKSGE